MYHWASSADLQDRSMGMEEKVLVSHCACTIDRLCRMMTGMQLAIGSWQLAVGLRWLNRIGVSQREMVRERPGLQQVTLDRCLVGWYGSLARIRMNCPTSTFMSDMSRVSPSSALHHSAYPTFPIPFSPSHRASPLLHLEKMRVGVVGCPHLALRDSAADSSI